MTKYALVFSSSTGNTAQLAERLREDLPGRDCLYDGAPADAAQEASLLFVGFWTDKGDCDAQTRAFLQTLQNKTIALFATAGSGGNAEYGASVLSRAAAAIPAGNRVLPGFLCQGKMQPSARKRYEALLAADPADARAAAQIENFDHALTHPDGDDLSHLSAWLVMLLDQVLGETI